MIRAELRSIEPNDFVDWETFAAAERPEPWDDFGWFTLSIGPLGDKGSELFQVLISTPAAVSRAKQRNSRFRGLIVGSFEPAAIKELLYRHVASLEGLSWQHIVEQLQQTMSWEYEGL